MNKGKEGCGLEFIKNGAPLEFPAVSLARRREYGFFNRIQRF